MPYLWRFLMRTYLFFDTETSDLIKYKLPNYHPTQPWVCQLAAILTDYEGNPINTLSLMVKSEGRPMFAGAADVHHLDVTLCDNFGVPPKLAFYIFLSLLNSCRTVVAHNISFDRRLLTIMARRLHGTAHADLVAEFTSTPNICTMRASTEFCKIPYPSGRKGNKWPKLEELYNCLFKELPPNAHDALGDVRATVRCFFELKKLGVIA